MKTKPNSKSPVKVLAAACLLAFAAATAIPAQAAPGGEGGACRTSLDGPERHGAMGFGRFADAPGRLLRGLDLSAAQRDRIFELRHARAPEERALMKQLHESRAALQALANSDDFDASKAAALAETHAQATGKLALGHAEFAAKLRALLSPEQRKTLDEKRAQAEKRAETRRGHRGGRHGEPERGPRGEHAPG